MRALRAPHPRPQRWTPTIPRRTGGCVSSSPVAQPGPATSPVAGGQRDGLQPAAPHEGSHPRDSKRSGRNRLDPCPKRKDSRSTPPVSHEASGPGGTPRRAPHPRTRWRAGCCPLRGAPSGNSPPERIRARTGRSRGPQTRRSCRTPAATRQQFLAATSELEMGGFGLYIGHLESRPGASPFQRASHRGGAPRSSVSSIDDGSNRCQ